MFQDVEDLIVDRLELKLAGLTPCPKIYTATDLENAKNWSQVAASVFVAYNGITGVDSMKGAPNIATLSQEFYVWTVTRSASRHGTQKGTREAADPILDGVIRALMGWKPGPAIPALELRDSPSPAYAEGFGYFPLVFSLRRQIRGDVS